MRSRFDEQLALLNRELIEMGALCEDVISIVSDALLGGAAAIEAVACVMAIRDGVVPPTIGYEQPDPECDLDVTPNQAVSMPVRVAISNSLGFGGHNACILFKKV